MIGYKERHEEIDRISDAIQSKKDKLSAIRKRSLPHARMSKGKADKQGNIEKSQQWAREIARLNELIETEQKTIEKHRQSLRNLGVLESWIP